MVTFTLESYENLLGLSKNSLTVLERRYLARDEEGKIIESPEQMFWRVAWNIASADAFYEHDIDPEIDKEEIYEIIKRNKAIQKTVRTTAEQFYKILTSLEFLPNSPTLMNAGRGLQQLSACFVLPINDSIGTENSEDGIYDAIKWAAVIHKSGGGTGFSFNRIRQRNSIVKSTGRLASGPLAWMNVLNESTESIKQGGTRRGANMGILYITHPDVRDFIHYKEREGALANFNISVGLTNEFMNAVEKDTNYTIIEPHTGKPIRKEGAQEIFKELVDMAWKNGEPGIIFIDRINARNPTIKVGRIEATNPCGEQPLLPYESCNLGSINLSKFVVGNEVNWERLKEVIKFAVHFLDNVIDMNNYPLNRINEMTKANRKIGLGVMGWADMLVQLGIPYNSKEAFELADKLMEFIDHYSKLASVVLAKDRGKFPNFKRSVFNEDKLENWFVHSKDSDLDWERLIKLIKRYGIRNATTTTIAPTGTIGIIANASGGIEPIFAVAYRRENVLDKDVLIEVNPYFERIAKAMKFYTKEIIDKISQENSILNIEEVPEDVRKVFVTAHDVKPEEHIRMQAEFQKHVDNAVSKTVNFPNSATKEDVEHVYRLAWELGCKGVTVYRDGSRQLQVLSTGSKKEQAQVQVVEERDSLEPRWIDVPDILLGLTMKIKTGCGNAFITISVDRQGVPRRIFNNMGKAGLCPGAHTQALCRMLSHYFKLGGDVDTIIEQLEEIACHRPSGIGPSRVVSCADAVAKALRWYQQFRREDRTYNYQKALDILIEKPDFNWWEISEDMKSENLDRYIPKESKSKKSEGLASGQTKLSSSGAVFGACRVCGGPVVEQEGCRKCMVCGAGDCS